VVHEFLLLTCIGSDSSPSARCILTELRATDIQVYRYLREALEQSSGGEADARMQRWLSEQLGPERVHLAQGVFRLILCEDDLFT
jgi:hypothetical protein